MIRCSTQKETEKWRKALETHVGDDYNSQFVHPSPIPTNPSLLRKTLVIDIGSCSIRAGILSAQRKKLILYYLRWFINSFFYSYFTTSVFPFDRLD